MDPRRGQVGEDLADTIRNGVVVRGGSGSLVQRRVSRDQIAMQERHPGLSGDRAELVHDGSRQGCGVVVQGGGRGGEVAGQQVRCCCLGGQLGEHREQLALPGRGAGRLAGQPVVLQRQTGAAPFEVVFRPDAVR